MRDDFIQSVKDILSKRVGLLCSNPTCKTLTIGPNSNENKATNIGVAAHITAASIGGPRYNPNISSEERSSISNAIWLCQSCAKMIDSDSNKFTTVILTNWKIEAELYAENKLNMKGEYSPEENYTEVFNLMPELISEIHSDLKDNPLFREFILLQRGWIYNSGGKKYLVYYFDDHDNLDAKIKLLENHRLVRNITYNNTQRYVLSEKLVNEIRRLAEKNAP
jgi:hypothetical protein